MTEKASSVLSEHLEGDNFYKVIRKPGLVGCARLGAGLKLRLQQLATGPDVLTNDLPCEHAQNFLIEPPRSAYSVLDHASS